MFDAFVIEGIPELERALDPNLWWDALERALPEAVEPVRVEMVSRAPVRSGKLANSITVTIRRMSQGFIRGVEALFGTGVPYGHLVEKGHKIIARGPSRSGLTKTKRAALRSGLIARRAAGAIGFVQARPFAEPAAVGHEAEVIARIEASMRMQLVA
jgi:hypothetical protein